MGNTQLEGGTSVKAFSKAKGKKKKIKGERDQKGKRGDLSALADKNREKPGGNDKRTGSKAGAKINKGEKKRKNWKEDKTGGKGCEPDLVGRRAGKTRPKGNKKKKV